jgi:glycosyltransferase involved in cell wall biosynthesis
MVATNVGGVPEIFGPYRDRLIPPDDADALADALFRISSAPAEELRTQADALAAFVATRFSLSGMADGVIAAYRDVLALKSQKPRLFRARFALPSDLR